MCKLLDYKIIAIARGIDEAHIIPTIQALIDGGIKAVELPLSHSSKESYKETLNIIKKAHDTFGDKIYLGAGTVLSTKEVEDAARIHDFPEHECGCYQENKRVRKRIYARGFNNYRSCDSI
jgi:2-dehydro-3-deoxyphosphogluconate aldolase/(4S)-4-hydroxy-2-oxoglutarate aldolase